MRTVKDSSLIKKNVSKKDVFFTVSSGNFRNNSTEALNTLSTEAKGTKLFEELIEEAEDAGHDFVIIALHKLASKNPQKKAYTKFKLLFSEEPQAQALGGFEMFGGLNGFVQKEVQNATLLSENEKYKSTLAETKLEKKSFQLENDRLKAENEELRRKAEKAEWNNTVLKRNHEFELESTSKQQNALDKILTLGGAALGSALDIDAAKMKGLLGFDESEPKEIPQQTETQNSNQDQNDTSISFEEEQETEYINEPAKAKSKTIADGIYTFHTEQIKKLASHEALALMNASGMITQFVAKEKGNLQLIIELINKQNNG